MTVSGTFGCGYDGCRRGGAALLGLLLVLASSGCGGPAGPKVISVTGKLTYQGAPVPNATITALPSDPGRGRPAMATTAADGSFSLQSAGGERPGVEPGSYKLRIEALKVPLSEIPPDQLMAREEENRAVPKKYFDEQTSGLTLSVTETDSAKELPLDLAE